MGKFDQMGEVWSPLKSALLAPAFGPQCAAMGCVHAAATSGQALSASPDVSQGIQCIYTY